MSHVKYLSLFSGIGGFELGIGNKGECVGYSEVDDHAIQIYQRHFPQHKFLSDITTIHPKNLSDFEHLVGGFPCQSFSIAGKRGGFSDTRGILFFEIARIAREKQPRLLLLENVKGLLSHDQGRTFYTIISTLDELGYDLQWQVLNSKNHGVPQNRERVFIVGHLRGTRRPKVFPFGENDEVPDRKVKSNIGRAQAEISSTVREGMGSKADSTFIQQLNQPRHSNDRVYGTDGVSPTLNTAQGGNRQPFIVAQRGGYPGNPKSRGAGLPTEQMLEPNLKGVSNTPSTVQKDNMLCDKDSKIRRLTPTECERLQGFPDGWTKGVSNTHRYKCLGNAVTVNVIRSIADLLL